jgi:glycosyltransferase involved in cell wall biosynthesis
LKIAFAVWNLGLGGTERRLLDLAAVLRPELDVAVVPMLPGGPLYDAELSAGRLTPPLPTGRSRASRLPYFARHFSNVDLVHAFDLQSGCYARVALTLARRRVPLISGTGASFVTYPPLVLLLRMGLLDPDLFLCNSEAGARAVRQLVGRRVGVDVIPNGLGLRRLAVPPEREGWRPEWTQSGRPVVGYVGKLDEYKHGERMVDLAERLAAHPADPLFVVFGGGPYLDATRRRVAQSADLRRRVLLMGPDPDASWLSRWFTVGVLCSDTEGLPNVLLEYLALGVPCVSTDVGDARQVLDEGRVGALVPRGDTHALAAAVGRYLSDPAARAAVVEPGRAHVAAKYSVEQMRQAHRSLYVRLLER